MKAAFPFVFWNDEIIEKERIAVSPFDIGLIRGAGIFDFFSVENGKPLFVADYLDRFFRSAEHIGLDAPLQRLELDLVIHELMRRNSFVEGGVRMVLTGGVSENAFSPGTPNLFITNEPLFPPSEAEYEKGITLLLTSYKRDLPSIKSLNYLGAVRLLPKMKEIKATDVLYHDHGYVREASRSNFFLVKNGVLITPSKDILAGITRKQLFGLAKENQLRLECRGVRLEELREAEEAFICSTTKRVLPVVKVSNHTIGNGKPGKVTQNIMELFAQKRKEACS